MEVWDSPNSAGVVIDAVRCAKLALDRGIGGPLEGPAAYLMKTPPRQYTDDQARQLLEEFIAGSGVVAPELEAPQLAAGEDSPMPNAPRPMPAAVIQLQPGGHGAHQ